MASKNEKVAPSVTALQVKDLLKRLEKVSYGLSVRAMEKCKVPEPANVKAARKLVEQFDKKKRVAKNAAADSARARVNAAKSLILFRLDMPKAIAALEALEREVRP